MYLLLSSLSVILLVCLAGNLMLIRYMRANDRAYIRDRHTLMQQNTDLTDRIMHMSGSTWTPPPRPDMVEKTESEEILRHREGWVGV